METDLRVVLGMIAALSVASVASADDAGAPLSAIDWLSDSLTEPRPEFSSGHQATDIAHSAVHAPVTTFSLDQALPDEMGLISASEAGLPRNLWGSSPASDIARRLAAEPLEMLPESQRLLSQILLARLDPPVDATLDHSLYLARIDRLLQLGLIDEAEALLEKAPVSDPDIFKRRFDVALLTGHENDACRVMQQSPEFSPTYPARIFCLARLGDWNAAALTLESANAIGILTEDQDYLMARFLDTELFEGDPPPNTPARHSPLTFRLFDAIGEPEATSGLPIAFAHSDLRPNRGWKAQLTAAERLAETGALPPHRLFALYRANRPSASGGIWERARAIQSLDRALLEKESGDVAKALDEAWKQMQGARLEYPFAEIYGTRLQALALDDAARAQAFRIGLLTSQFEDVADMYEPRNAEDRFLISIARGLPGQPPSGNALARAVSAGFQGDIVPFRYRRLMDADKPGEALLKAIRDFSDGAYGDYVQITDALRLMRAMGLEDSARRAALELMVLERRG